VTVAAAGAGSRVLFIDEAVHGHSTLMANIRRVADGTTVIQPCFARVPEPAGVERLLVAQVPGLGDLDLQPVRWRLRYSLRSARLARRADPAAVFVNTQSCALTAPQRDTPPPWIVSVDITHRQFAAHEVWRPRSRFSPMTERLGERLERRAYAAAHTIIAWTEWTAASLRDDYGVPPERIVVMHCGVDARLYGGIERPERRPGEPLRLLFIGNQVRLKGLDLLLEALDRCTHPAELDVVTFDEIRDGPRHRVHRGIQQGTEAFADLLARADAFVFPTRGDAVPWVVLETMAAGLPVVSTAVGAIPELVGDAGMIVDREPAAIARAIDALAADPARRAELGARARARVAERYDAWTQVPRLLAMLRDAAGPPG
jgi:glycosyltransferase involved in cell wall biosynthesis